MPKYEWIVTSEPKNSNGAGSYNLINTKTEQKLTMRFTKESAMGFIRDGYLVYQGNVYCKDPDRSHLGSICGPDCSEVSDCPECNTQSRTCLPPTVCGLCGVHGVDTWAHMGKLDFICASFGRAELMVGSFGCVRNDIIRVFQKVKCIKDGIKCNISLPVNKCLTCDKIGPYLTSENIGIIIDDSENISPINISIVQKCLTENYFLNLNGKLKVTTSDGISIEDIMRKTSESKEKKKKKKSKAKK